MMDSMPSPPSPSPLPHVLVVEDESRIAELIRMNLEAKEFRVSLAGDGRSALALQRESPPDLVVLDLMLPDMDGFEVLQTLRLRQESLPVLILTARTSDEDRLQGLTLGADDYLGKPFSILELIARIQAILRRSQPARELPGRILCSGPFRINLVQLTVHRGRVDLQLTLREFRILEALVAHPGRAHSRRELIQMAWNVDARPLPRTVNVHIGTLRRKLGDSEARPFIQTLEREGYRWLLPVRRSKY
ncbi:DNA-binding response regulator [Mesoterricola silvestris]|uniref:DNA-binding response regulator n=2 Tax=Mesoterricola silvestris TaxID=2927979 RepID=A0AA48GRF6_9BACT|nr:DNA-binding response regulator [Mesoterricola silvestris]